MYIVDYERGEVVNMANVVSLYKDERTILAQTIHREIILGKYADNDRTTEVFGNMLKDCFNPETQIARPYFYMPER